MKDVAHIIALLGLLSFAAFFIFSFIAIFSLIRRNGKAKSFAKIAALFFGICIALMVIDSPDTSDVDSPETDEVQVEEESEEEEQEDEKEQDKEKDEAAKKKKAATTKEKAEKKPEKKAEEKPKSKDTNSNRIAVQLDRVVDGDTAYFIVDGVSENTRFLLIDTPETKSPNTCVQPYGQEASDRLKQLLSSGNITIEYDGPKRDKYDRLLAHVFVDGKSVQETLLEEGLARIAYIYDPPYKYMDQYEAAEQRAKSAGKNIWSKSGYVTDRGFTDCVDGSSSSSKSSSSSSSKSSSNQSSSSSSGGSKENFKNCTELRKVYPDGVPKGHPAYQGKMDRDKDDWACE